MIKIVVADDHPVVRDGLIGMFADEPGIEVVGQADDGPQAVAIAGHTDPDVILMDLRMPGGDGIEAIRELRRADAVRPRILVLTTYDSDREVRTAVQAGADGFLLKDVRRGQLVQAVRDLAAGRAVLTPAALAVLAGRDREPQLSDRELQVLRQVASGHTNRAVARALMISEATVKTHLLRIYDKLEVGDRAAAVRVAYERGVL
jgi:DNA-binding NarL/FixJ family response regulator